MNTVTKAVADKAQNYSAEQVERLESFDSISFELAQELAVEFGKTPRSIIAKVKQLGLTYIPKAKPSKKVSKGDTKAELVTKIEALLDASDMLAGLEKSTASALVNLLGCAKIAVKNGNVS